MNNDFSKIMCSKVVISKYICLCACIVAENFTKLSRLAVSSEVIKCYFCPLISMFQVNCAYLHGVKWDKTGMGVGRIDRGNIECLTDHLSSFTMVIVLDAKVYGDIKENL